MYQRIIRNNLFFGASASTFELAKQLRGKMTVAEHILWARLKNKKLLNVKFRRQHPVGVYVLDFYCHEYKLAVEIDGEIHEIEDIHEHDLNREEELNKFGIRILRFSNAEIFEELDNVISRIKSELNTPATALSPRPLKR